MIHMTKEYFNRCMDRAVYEKIHKYQDFYLLMKFNDGIHPINYLDSMRRLRRARVIKKTEYRRMIKSAHRSGFTPGEDMIDILPVPHMLDFDWRFSFQAIKHLYQKIRTDAPKETGTIVFIGTPSLWKYCLMHLPERLHLILVDINASKHIAGTDRNNIAAIDIDINNKPGYLRKIHADIIVMDPPWYFNYYRLFFDRANEMAQVGTLVYCIMPPKYTRFTAEQETLDILKIIKEQYGMTKISYHISDVSYHTPPFEVNVLKAHGIECLPPNWRVGDLLIVKKVEIGSGNSDDLTVNSEQWDEYIIDAIRIKLGHTDREIESYSIHLVELYKDNIFPSVKRSANKKNINVWTSGNRVFWCDNIPLLKLILSRWGKMWIDDSIGKEDMESIGEVQRIIENVVETEMSEYGTKWRAM